MNPRRDMRNNRVALFDGIEEGGIRATSSYSHEIDEHDNERAMEGLQDRVNLLKRLSGDIHEEVDSHNRMLDRMGNDMDSSRGILSGTMDKFKMEAASEVGVNLKEGYNGDLSSREAGSVGGQMVKKMIESYEKNL